MQDQPPGDAVPLADAFERYTDPQLLEALRQAEERLRAAKAAVPPQPNWFEGCWGGRFDEALKAWQQRPEARAVAEITNVIADALRAVTAGRMAHLVSGEWRAWGREDKPWGSGAPSRLTPGTRSS